MHRSREKPQKPLRARLKERWKRASKAVMASPVVAGPASALLAAYIRLVHRTNPLVSHAPAELDRAAASLAPFIVTCWHGQHFIVPMFRTRGQPTTIMVSRSSDAELNARVIERLGFRTVRASGGRNRRKTIEKGGISGLLALKTALESGESVSMIADIPKGKAREAGAGIVTLAKLSGRPILPVAYASSRSRVLESTWDRTTINLPFGRAAFRMGNPVWVPEDADEEMLRGKRLELARELDDATARAYRALGATR